VKLSAKSAYAWSGTETEYSVPTTRNGTFNIDPVGDIDGFYIGNRSLSTIITSYIPDIKPIADNIISNATANGENITINNHSLILGSFALKNSIIVNDLSNIFDGKVGLSTSADISGEISSAISNSLSLGTFATKNSIIVNDLSNIFDGKVGLSNITEISREISNNIKSALNLKQFAYNGITSTDLTIALDGKVGLSTAADISGEISSAISNSLNLGELAHADKFEPLSGQSFELSEFDTRDMLKLIITSLGGKLTLNGEEI